jgi:hypothetical protein
MGALHFLHVRKTGGTALKRGFRKAGLPETPYGPIELQPHALHFRHVPADDHVIFCLRDPVARFVSGFYSRLRKGQPRYFIEWRPVERAVFEAYPTPQELADGLGRGDELARTAMDRIYHLRPMTHPLGPVEELEARLHQVVYVGRQETLAADWEHIKALLGLRPGVKLPSDPGRAHRRDASVDTSLDGAAVRTLQEWYAGDYRLLAFCEELRARRGWGTGAVDRARTAA